MALAEVATQQDAERHARIDLAALYRMVENHGWGEGIYNHISMRVPDEPDLFLIKAHPLTYEEVTASNLVKVSMHDDLDEQSGVNRPGYNLHSAILRARPDVNCALHIHSTIGIAISAHAGGLRMLSQNATKFYKRLGYHNYEGITEDAGEQPRIVRDLGQNRALILRNHGVVTVGANPREAYMLMNDLIISAEVQLRLEAAGAPTVEIPDEICEKVAEQFERHDKGRGKADWPALLRRLDRADPSYKD